MKKTGHVIIYASQFHSFFPSGTKDIKLPSEIPRIGLDYQQVLLQKHYHRQSKTFLRIGKEEINKYTQQ